MTLVLCTWTIHENIITLYSFIYNVIFKILATLYNKNLINNNFLAISANNYID